MAAIGINKKTGISPSKKPMFFLELIYIFLSFPILAFLQVNSFKYNYFTSNKVNEILVKNILRHINNISPQTFIPKEVILEK